MKKAPQFSSDIQFVPVSFADRDIIVGKIMEVIEASMPDSKQQEAVKSLIKQRVSDHFVRVYNEAFHALNNESVTTGSPWDNFVRALWETQQETEKLASSI